MSIAKDIADSVEFLEACGFSVVPKVTLESPPCAEHKLFLWKCVVCGATPPEYRADESSAPKATP